MSGDWGDEDLTRLRVVRHAADSPALVDLLSTHAVGPVVQQVGDALCAVLAASAMAIGVIIRSAIRRRGLRPVLMTAAQTLP